jgi:hypothetical protein
VRSHTRYHFVNGTTGREVGNDDGRFAEEMDAGDMDAGDGSGAPAKSAKPKERSC